MPGAAPAVIRYDPLPAFKEFHACSAIEAALIGGYGSGKSRALVAEALKLGLAYPGSEHLVARKTIPSLRDTTENDFIEQMPKELWDACEKVKGGGHYQYIILPNGSKYYFKGLDDWRKIKSLNLMGIFVDEADEIDEDTYEGLTSRLRQVQPRQAALRLGATSIPFRVIRLASNPAGRNWIWHRFVKNGGRERPAFISTSLDNPYNPIAYIEHLLSFPEQWVKRFVFCSFDDFEGTIYPEWDWPTHVVKPYGQYTDPRGFFWMGMDPGTDHPTAGIWAYWDPTLPHRGGMGKLVIVAEYAKSGLSASHHIDEWRKIEAHGTHNLSRHPGRMKVRRRIADPTIATRDRGSMMSLEAQYLREGFHFEHGPRQIPERMPMLGQLIHTEAIAVTEECMQTYEQIQQYRYEDLTPDQKLKGSTAKPLKKDVDLVDASQYIASRWLPEPTPLPKPAKDPREDEGVVYSNDSTAELIARGVDLTDDWRLQAADLVAGIAKNRNPQYDTRADSSRGM
jgi:PBSX family phage terminase large subunit